jgi:hypothetical protein
MGLTHSYNKFQCENISLGLYIRNKIPALIFSISGIFKQGAISACAHACLCSYVWIRVYACICSLSLYVALMSEKEIRLIA